MTDVVNADGAEPRFGDWGPGYLLKGEDAAYGVVTLRPGDEFANHYHAHHEETFFLFEGEIELWLGQVERIDLRTGDLARCPARVHHYLRNVSGKTARALFVKAPNVEGDKVEVAWTPPGSENSVRA